MIYLDNAATSRYVPEGVIKAAVRCLNRKCNAGRGSHNDSVQLGLAIYRVRRQIAALLDNDRAEVIFGGSCTQMLNLAILGATQGGHVVTTATEHNSVLRPLHELRQAGKITLTVVYPASWRKGVQAQEIENAIRSDTHMVVVNHVSNVTGIANDVVGIGAVCAKYGITYVLDAAQSIGHMPLSMRRIGCDMLAAPAHKGLHGLQGVGFLAVNKSVRLQPIWYGGTGTDSANVLQPTTMPEGLEAGTLNGAGIVALGEGIDWTQKHMDKIRRIETTVVDRLRAGLEHVPGVTLYGGGCGIVSMAIAGYSSATVADAMNDVGIAVRGGLHCAPLMHRTLGTLRDGLVRISAGYNNRPADADRVIETVQTLVRQR